MKAPKPHPNDIPAPWLDEPTAPNTEQPTATNTETATATNTETATATNTEQPTATNTETATATNTETATATNTETATATNTERATAGTTPGNTEPALDPFDIAALRLDQSFIQDGGAKKLLTTVPVRKPNKQDFVRVHPDKAFREAFAIIELKDDREAYLLLPEVARSLPNEFFMAMVFTAINRQGVVFLWPVKLPGPDGKTLRGTRRRRRPPSSPWSAGFA